MSTAPLAAPLRRPLLAAGGLAALGGALALLGPWALPLWLAPDLTFLAALGAPFDRDGRLAPRAVPAYNAAHALPGPVALAAAGALLGPVVLGLGLLWLSHVLLDRALGYGLRRPDGAQRG